MFWWAIARCHLVLACVADWTIPLKSTAHYSPGSGADDHPAVLDWFLVRWNAVRDEGLVPSTLLTFAAPCHEPYIVQGVRARTRQSHEQLSKRQMPQISPGRSCGRYGRVTLWGTGVENEPFDFFSDLQACCYSYLDASYLCSCVWSFYYWLVLHEVASDKALFIFVQCVIYTT